ncbi:hypothetical protein [Streptomyces sp. NPDC058632]|uniref:hypothetical protein n=1 Tax=unclassified Streptomyces TaxID=2593676 RepID=UPI00365DF3DD
MQANHWFPALSSNCMGPWVLVEVTGTRTGPPCPPDPGGVGASLPLDEHGRGLLLVEALAERWEAADREPPAKTVRAEVRVDGDREGH